MDSFSLERTQCITIAAIVLVILGVVMTAWAIQPSQPVPLELNGSLQIRSICYDEHYEYVAASTYSGLLLYDLNDDFEIMKSSDLVSSFNIMELVHLESSPKVYALTDSPMNPIVYYSYPNESWYEVLIDIPYDVQVEDIEIGDSDNQIYVASNVGLVIYDLKENSTTILTTLNGLLANETKSLLWVSDCLLIGYNNGFGIMNSETMVIENQQLFYRRATLAATSLEASQDLSCIYVGTDKGVRGFSYENHEIVPLVMTTNSVEPGIETLSLELDSVNNVLFAVTSDGLYWYDISLNSWGGDLSSRLPIRHQNITCLLMYNSREGPKLYVGTPSGLVILDTSSLDPALTNAAVFLKWLSDARLDISTWLSIIAISVSLASPVYTMRRGRKSKKASAQNVKRRVCRELHILEDDIEACHYNADLQELRDILSSTESELSEDSHKK